MPFLKEKHQYTTEAICIKSLAFGEADKILHFYSPRMGRISAIAKGVRRTKSHLAGACEILSLSELQLAKGRNLDVLCQYQSLEAFSKLRHDLLGLACALLFAELVDLIATEHDLDSGEIYRILVTALRQLETSQNDMSGEGGRITCLMAAVDFQMNLLEAAGYHPAFENCILCGVALEYEQAIVKTSPPTPLQGGTSITFFPFSPHLGGVVCTDCRHEAPSSTLINVSTATLRVLRSPWEAERWQLAEPKKIQKFLAYYFSYKMEKKIHAFDFLSQQIEYFEPSLNSPGVSL